jgi:anti-sigma regulatory factor (Ser/Thr protein kinase)
VTATGRANAEQYQALAIERTVPALVLEGPSPIGARHAIRSLAPADAATSTAADDLISALSEVVTNAHAHGSAPVQLQAWVDEAANGLHRMVVVVSDHGTGVADHQTGAAAPLVRAPGKGGFGLFLARQLCDEVTIGFDGDAFRVRLVRHLPSGPSGEAGLEPGCTGNRRT